MNKLDTEAKCPFYVVSGNTTITCESAFAESVKTNFRDYKTRAKYGQRFCANDNYIQCVLYKCCMTKYEE